MIHMSCIAVAIVLIGGCSSAEKGTAVRQKVQMLATQKLGNNFETVPNSTKEFFLCSMQEKERAGVPIRPIKFFVFSVQRDSIVYEHELENGTVEWHNETQLMIKHIPGTITGDESPDAFTEIYDLRTGKTTKQ